jgi:hypothetical protein
MLVENIGSQLRVQVALDSDLIGVSLDPLEILVDLFKLLRATHQKRVFFDFFCKIPNFIILFFVKGNLLL